MNNKSIKGSIREHIAEIDELLEQLSKIKLAGQADKTMLAQLMQAKSTALLALSNAVYEE